MSSVRAIHWQAIAAAAAATTFVAALGATMTDLGPWYQSLKEPSWKPPDEAFGLIWTVIFALAGASALLAWRNEPSPSRRQWVLALFAANGFLNVLWTLMFFQIRRPDLALLEVGALWLSILVLIVVVFRRSVLASALLLPYLVWVGIAAVLNYQVVALNGPFG